MATLTKTTANPQTINISLDSSGLATGSIFSTTHAEFAQRVVLKLMGGQPGAEEQTITFEGRGENIPMKLAEAPYAEVYNMINWMLPITGTATLYYDAGNGYVAYPASQVSMEADPGGGTITIRSEDSTDMDDNDIVLVIKTQQ